MDNRLDPSDEISQWLNIFARYHPKSMDMDLSRTHRLMRDLGDPYLKLPPVIHVAGTNGKGSSLAFMRAMLESVGLKVHVMTSPHLVEFRERFVVSSAVISNDILADYMGRINAMNAGQSATFFELITAVGFQLFHDFPADICLLETGMGGRLDATNIIPKPLCTLITMISKDHQQFLGNDLTSIAFEKAGIMKEGVPCVIGSQTDEAWAAGVMKVFEERAQALGVSQYRHNVEWGYEVTNDGFSFDLKGEITHCPRPNLLGAHQYANAAAALVTLKVAGYDITRMQQGITKALWRGRLQPLHTGVFQAALRTGDELWLDGGHNDSAGAVLAAQIAAWRADDATRDTHLIIGMLKTKNPHEFVAPMRDHLSSITAIAIPDQDLSFAADDLASILKSNHAQSVDEAIRNIVSRAQKPLRILIAGSLYLAGYVLKDNN